MKSKAFPQQTNKTKFIKGDLYIFEDNEFIILCTKSHNNILEGVCICAPTKDQDKIGISGAQWGSEYYKRFEGSITLTQE